MPSFLPDGLVGIPYEYQCVATGGTPPYAWTIAAGTITPGLTLHSATGVIDGTPTTYSHVGNSFTVRVTDAAELYDDAATIHYIYWAVQSAAVNCAGTGYTVNDQLTVVGGGPNTPAVLNVDSVGEQGDITALSVVNHGSYDWKPDNPVGLSGGSGSDATADLTWYPES